MSRVAYEIILKNSKNELCQINLEILVITEHGLTEDDLKLSYVQGVRLDEKYLEWWGHAAGCQDVLLIHKKVGSPCNFLYQVLIPL